jgi:plasmid stabilization system protein ParE
VAYQVTLSPRAEQYLIEIWLYVSANDSEAATTLCFNLMDCAFSLGTFPERNPRHRLYLDIRKVPMGEYSVIYRIKPHQRHIEVLRFWHAAQNPRRLRLRESAPAYPAAR